MSSSEDKLTDTGAISQQVQFTNVAESQDRNNQEQLFSLIDTILSFEACLYHQILPFKLENNHLLLGIVNPKDEEALSYVSSILGYMNYSVTTEQIKADIHRKILSAYLNHKNRTQGSSALEILRSVKISVNNGSENPVVNNSNAKVAPTESNESSVNNITSRQNPSQEQEHIKLQENIKLDESAIGSKPVNSSSVLDLPQTDSSICIDKILTLPPRRMLEELLARVLNAGIGRLYLERRPYHGRILWSENGVIQSTLEELQLSVFQGVLNELKRFTGLPITTIAETQQIEKEYLYQKQRLLLRLQVMPGMYGEKATLQALRGTALEFYQNQQVSRLSEDALSISQQLSYKLHEIQAKLLQSSNNNPEKIESLRTLNRLLKNLDRQIKSI